MRLRSGQIVLFPPFDKSVTRRPTGPVSEQDSGLIRNSIIFEDSQLIAINKPPGIASQGGRGHERNVDGLAASLAAGPDRPRLVHRLDRDTSGVLLLARTAHAARQLAGSFRCRNTAKIYWAILDGVPKPKQGTIKLGIAANASRAGGVRVVSKEHCLNDPNVRRAETSYIVAETLGRRLSAVALMPLTGRKHQLRAHMAAIGCPIIGDNRYALRNPALPQGFPAGLQLHAHSITLPHPADHKPLAIEAPAPERMLKALICCGWDVLALVGAGNALSEMQISSVSD